MQTRPVVTTPVVTTPVGPSYSQRARGLADRADYSDAAGEAGALTGTAAPVNAEDFDYAQAIRDETMKSAGAQTDRFFEIRRNAANDATNAAVARHNAYVADQNNLRSWAEMALQGKFKNRELGMEQQRINNEAQYKSDQTDIDYGRLSVQEKDARDRAKYQNAQIGLQGRELTGREKYQNAQIDQEARRLGLQDKNIQLENDYRNRALDQTGKYQNAQIDQEARRLGLQDREIQGRERLGMLNDYTPESVAQYEKSGDIASLRGRDDKSQTRWRPGNNSGVYKSMLEQNGYDVTGLYKKDGTPTQKGFDFQDALNFYYLEQGVRDDPSELARRAAEQIGLSKPSAPDSAGSATPVPKGLPRGAKLIKQSGNVQTWETPDGKLFDYTPE